jgi:ATP-dependent DNA helicase RecG
MAGIRFLLFRRKNSQTQRLLSYENPRWQATRGDKLILSSSVEFHQLSLQSPAELPDLDKVFSRIGKGTPASELESQTLEFKEPAGSIKATLELLADAAVCFVNADGGRIVLGVNDKATDRANALVGVSLDYSVEVIRRGIFDRTTPRLTLGIAEKIVDGVRLLVLDVPPGVTPHSNNAGTATRRLGTECRPFPPAEQREFLVARGQIDWSAQPSGLPIGELSKAEIQRIRSLLSDAGAEDLSRLRDRALLEGLRLIADDGTATQAAVLLLADEPDLSRLIPTYGYSYQYRPSPGSEATQRIRGQRPVLVAVEILMQAVESRIELRPLNLAGGVQLQLLDYPQSAVREFVVNALIHRAYDINGSVDLEHSPERLTITSPGGLVAGVTPANILTHPSTPRHRLLMETVARCQLAERTGQGVDRAYREMLRAGKAPPHIEDLQLRVRATLSGGIGNDAFVRFIQDLPYELGGDVEVLIALSLLRDKPSIDAHALATNIQRGPVEAQDVLERLADDRNAILEPTRSTSRRSFPSYRLRNKPLAELARAVSYRPRRKPDEVDAKVIEHIREYGFITNKTLQRIFDLNLYAARNMLLDLRERDLVEKIGDARGGPGVKYGPGSKFPKRRSRKKN